jgi:hypothetical protein
MRLFLIFFSASWSASALDNGLGLTPSMGWMQPRDRRASFVDGLDTATLGTNGKYRVECAQTEDMILSVGRWLTVLGLDIVRYDMVALGGTFDVLLALVAGTVRNSLL